MNNRNAVFMALMLTIFFACKEENSMPMNPHYDVDPMRTVHQEQGVRGYERIINTDTAIYYIDSVVLDRQGNTILNHSFSYWSNNPSKRFLSSESKYEYDSLGRLTALYQESDIRVELVLNYKFNEEKCILTQTWRDTVTNDSWIQVYEFDKDCKKPVSMVKYRKGKGLASNSFDEYYGKESYTYNNGLISKVTEEFGGEVRETLYAYNNDLKLIYITRLINGEPLFIDYISKKNGLYESRVSISGIHTDTAIYKYY